MRISLCLLAIAVFAGEADLSAQPRILSLSNAISAALENNATLEISEAQSIEAAARADEQRAALLPNVTAHVSYVNQVVNLGDRGIRLPGIPIRVGPFGFGDIRVQFTEPILDISLIRRYQASRRSASSSEFETQAVRSRVAAMVAQLYYGVQRARAMVGSTDVQIQLADSLLKLAVDRQQVGVGTRLDVTRADSRLAAERFRLIQAQNDVRTGELQLLRAMGDRLDIALDLTDALAAGNVTSANIPESVEVAFRNRPELKSAAMKLEAAGFSSSASRAEWFPNIQVFGDYGDSGTLDSFVPTRILGVQVNIPVFDGGRRRAHGKMAASQLRQAEVRAKDVRDQIELEVRIAVDSLTSAAEQLRVAEQALGLAEEELDLSRLRFEAQVTTQIDVLNAQAELAVASARQVNALFVLKSAEVEYWLATGMDIR